MSAYKELGKAVGIVREVAPTGDEKLDRLIENALDALRGARDYAEGEGK